MPQNPVPAEVNRLGDIAAFVAAVKTGSFTAAAASLGLSRSAIGKSVVRLEARLATRLLHRTTRRLSLTDEGRCVYERWQQILAELQDVEDSVALRRGQPSSTLKLTAPLSFGQRHILPLLDAYMKQWPQLRADIRLTDRYLDVVEEGFDIAVRIGHGPEDSQLLTRTLAWQQYVTSAAPDYLARRGTPQSPQELDRHDCIRGIKAGQPRDWHYQTSEGLYLHQAPARMLIDNSEAARQTALAGFGLVHMPSYITGDDLRAGTLVEVLKPYRPPADPIRVLYPSRQYLAPRTRGFIDLLVQRWQGGVPWEMSPAAYRPR